MVKLRAFRLGLLQPYGFADDAASMGVKIRSFVAMMQGSRAYHTRSRVVSLKIWL